MFLKNRSASFVRLTIAQKTSSAYSRFMHPDVITKILYQVFVNDIGYKACYCKLFFFYPNKLYYLQTSRKFHIIPFRFFTSPRTLWPCPRRHPHPGINRSVQNHSGTISLAMRNERRSASVPLLLVHQLSIRTNAIPPVKDPPTTPLYLHCQNLEK